MEKCRSGVYDAMEGYMAQFAAEGYSAAQLLNQLHERVVLAGELTDHQKSAIAEKMAVSGGRPRPFLLRMTVHLAGSCTRL